MEPESGCRNSPIWLIGDSPPDRWKDCLSVPLDPRHPARHSIWTPIIDGIQERAFRRDRLRLDTCRIHVRNAVLDRSHKAMAKGRDWSGLDRQIEELGRLLNKYRPRLVLTFGAFSYEFTKRSLKRGEDRAYSHWDTKRLGEEFRSGVETYSASDITLLPLLHASIARGKFLVSHRYFTQDHGGNYFDYVAEAVAGLLLCHRDDLSQLWVS